MSVEVGNGVSADGPEVRRLGRVVIRFAGDSGDGMQLTGDRFTSEAAAYGNDLATLPNYPAEIRAPQGTLPGVSSFQLHFADYDILTPGDRPDVLVAMNPAALKANIGELPAGGVLIVNTDEFTKRNLSKVGYAADPLGDGSLDAYQVYSVPMATLTRGALAETGLGKKDAERAKNMFALGLLSWMYTRPTEGTEAFLRNAPDWVADWTGFRPDSAPPIPAGEGIIRWWQDKGRDPREKLLIFSDGMDVDSIEQTHRHFAGRVRTSFGWGTNLTNDFVGCSPDGTADLDPISLVCKVTSVNGRPAVKLSDNPEKATGSPDEIVRYLRVFGDAGRVRTAVRV